MLPRVRVAAAILPVLCLTTLLTTEAQSPSALPYTMTTIGGLAPMTAASGTQCPNLPTGVLSTDAYGDGCLAVNGIFGTGAYSGVLVDSFGNVFVSDDINGVLHMINPTTGIMTAVAGVGTTCGAGNTALDSSGDGCVAATGTSGAILKQRGVGIDPYGNILVAGYNDHLVHMICRNASPLCGSVTPSATNPIQIPVGNMGLVAGCTYSGGSAGVTGAGTDNTPGFSTATSTYSGSPFVNAGGSASACTAALGEVDQPRGATADVYGNVYYADTASERLRVVLGPLSYNSVTNPLWAVLEENSTWYNGTTLLLKAGYVYTVANTATTATVANSQSHCNGNTSNPAPYATDTHGDGCLFTSASVNSSSSGTQGVAVDAAGNVLFTDAGNGLLRVFFVSNGLNFASGSAGHIAGQAMLSAINVNNSGYSNWTSPTMGFVYMLAGAGSGSGTGSVSTTPRLGYSTTSLSSGITKVTVSPQGNIFIGYGSTTATSNKVIFFDINTGYIRTLFTTASANVTAGSYCSGSSGPKSLSAYSDGCPASVSEFGGSTASGALSVAVDGLGNLYLYDGNSASGELVRKVLAQGFAPQTLETTQLQIFQAHIPGASSLGTSTATLTATPDISAGTPVCTRNGDSTVDCTVTVTSKPSAPGLRSATLTVSNSSSGTYANIELGGMVTGAALAFDNASTTTNGITTPIAPTKNAIFSSITPAAVVVDGAGNVYAASGTSILESIGGMVYTLSTAPGTPRQLAVDQTGNLFAVFIGQSQIGELQINVAGSPATYAATWTLLTYTPTSGTATPQGIAVDSAGNLFIADYQASGSAIYRLARVGNTIVQQTKVATGLTNPVSLGVDSSGNVYVADQGAGAVYKLTPGTTGAYTQTTLISSVTPVAVAMDPAGDVYVQSGASVLEIPVSGSEATVLTGLQNPVGLAVDGLGNVYSADASNSSIPQVVRDAGSYGTPSTTTTTFAGTLTNIGNLSTALTQTDASEFPLTFGSGSGCSSAATNYTTGLACTVQANFSSSKSSGTALTDQLTFTASGSVGSVTFNDLVPAGPTSMSITGPGNPPYAASGTEATYTITVTGIAAPTGTAITVTVTSLTTLGAATVATFTPTLNSAGQTPVILSGLAAGTYTISANYAGVTNVYAPSSAQLSFTIEQYIATGDSRTVTEPSFPAVCATLNAALTSVNDDLPASVDATVTNPDGARIQAALNSCSTNNPGQAVELSVDGAGHNAYLTGPLSMPSNVTLLVDPGVYVYFSRNAQDYDKVSGTHTCGTVGSASATSSCLPLIDIPRTSSNVGIMGFGKLDGRGGDALINAIAPYAGQSWWGLSSIANSGGTQENPRFIQMDTGASNITLYKITLRNSPLFHVSTTGAVTGFTAWDIKIITPTNSRNTDGIDPGNATNFTITRSWISDGDDNVAVGGAGTTAPASNISVTNNHFFAGHGESIGSYTSAGVSNILFDGNMSSGNGTAGVGSSINNIADSNSTGLRIKSGYDRGGVVSNIQYSNSCFQGHKAEIVFSPNYEATTGSESPNLENILLQNLTFLTAGTVQFTGTSNGSAVYPLGVTLDNVSFPATFPASEFSPAPTNAALTYGPGQVSTDFVSDYATFAGSNGNTVTSNITETSLVPPTCNFTYIAPELTGPTGLPQTITQGENATVVVILTPAVGGAAYPTGTVTLTDALTSTSTTVTLPGTTDTLSIPLGSLSAGTHTFTATYSGDTNYTLTAGQTVYSTTAPYVITINAGSLNSTTTSLSGVPGSTSYGTSFTATATVTGSNLTGVVQFIVGGGGGVGSYVYATAALTSGTASAAISLPYSITAYTVTAVYSGDSGNQGSSSTTNSVIIGQAITSTTLSANATTTSLGHPVSITASVSSLVGVPTGTVNFTYSITSGGAQIPLSSSVLSAGAASASVDLPIGTDYVTATYIESGSFAGSTSAAMTITVNAPTIIPLPGNPIALPYTMTTIAGGSGLAIPGSGNMACAGATDKYGDGCQGTAISLTSGDDMRAVVADPFGNVYLSDISAALVRRITPNGVISNFAGRVTGTACVPTATAGCTPTLVSIGKARGVGTDAAGNIYIANYTGNQVFEVKVSTGLMYLVAGNGTAGSTGDGNAATSAEVNNPRGAWGDTVGNIYIADTAGNKIRVVDVTGNIHTFAGTGTGASSPNGATVGDGGPATSAEIDNPQGVITDANLNVYIADSSGGRIRVVCVTCGTGSPLDALLGVLGVASPVNGDIYTIAGNGSGAAYSYTAPVLATSVSMSPQKLAFDTNGNLYISDGNGVIWFLDFHTGYIREIAANGTVCGGASSTYGYAAVGDGCPATQTSFGDGGNGIGVGADTQGNIYISDTTNGLIRKVITGLASPSTAVGATTTQSVLFHFIANAALTDIAHMTNEWTSGIPSCSANTDATTDCLVSSSFTPGVPGARSTPMMVTDTLSHTANLALTGTGLGAGATVDPAKQISFGTNLSVAGLATDTAGNVYVSDATSKNVYRYSASALTQGTSASATTLATLTAPGAVAVDPRGYVYVADTSTGLITQITPADTVSTLPLTFTAPAGVAVDALNNLYVSDSSAQAAYQINPITGVERNLNLGTLVTPKGLTIDPSGNLLVADAGAPAVYRYNFSTNTLTPVTTSAVAPSAVVTDAAGNLLIADSASILAVPDSANSASFTVAGIAPSALAIDTAGNLYTGSGGGVLELIRTQGYIQFSGPSAAAQTVSLLDSGNQVLQVTSANQSDANDYTLTPNATTDCQPSPVSGGSATLTVGGVCALTTSYTPTTYIPTTDTVTLNGNMDNAQLSTPPLVQFVLTGPATAPASGITISSFSPSSPVYGQTVTVYATVTGATLEPTGTVVFTLDSTTTSSRPVNGSGVASVSVSGLSGGLHKVSAAYTSTNGYAASTTSSATSFNIAKASPTLTWATPAAITYGTALSGAQLNAVATGVTGASLPGTFTYAPIAGTVVTGGSQTLSVSFAPTDTTDYATATATVQLTVNKAASAVTVTPSINPVLLQNPVTYTATVSSAAGKPTGTVTFEDGGLALAACTGVTVTTSTGVASCAVTYTAVGTHSITVLYNGDANFLTSASSALSGAAIDITLGNPTSGSGTGTSATILPGGTTTYTFPIAPSSSTSFPAPLTFTVSVSPALPAGTTMSLTPSSWVLATSNPWSWTLPANTTLTGNTVLSIQVPRTIATAQPIGGTGVNLATRQDLFKLAPYSLALLLVPFAGRLRKSSKRLGRLLTALLLAGAGMAAMAGLSGCGSNNGFFAQTQQSYSVTVIVSSGSLSHNTTSVTLVVE